MRPLACTALLTYHLYWYIDQPIVLSTSFSALQRTTTTMAYNTTSLINIRYDHLRRLRRWTGKSSSLLSPAPCVHILFCAVTGLDGRVFSCLLQSRGEATVHGPFSSLLPVSLRRQKRRWIAEKKVLLRNSCARSNEVVDTPKPAKACSYRTDQRQSCWTAPVAQTPRAHVWDFCFCGRNGAPHKTESPVEASSIMFMGTAHALLLTESTLHLILK